MASTTSESLNMYLTISKDDLAMREPRPADLTDRSSAADKTHYRLWLESNRVCLTVLKYTIDKTIRQSIAEKDTAVDYLKAISEKFKKFDKSQKAYYLSLLDNTLYGGASGVREHMMKLVNYFNKLKSLKVDLVTQEEESLKKAKSCTHSVNNITKGSSRKGGHEKYKGKKHQDKRSFGPKKDNKKDKGKMKKSFKGNCFYCKKSDHSISECFKLKNKREKEVNTITGHKRQRTDENSSMLWHRRLGHISRDRLERMVKQDILHNLDFSDFDSCVDCIKGKFPARAKSERASRSESILDLIHTDIGGPISSDTLGNYKYFITFMDDYSEFGWIDLLHEKSDSLDAFKAFKAVVELKSEKVIKSVRAEVRPYNPQLKKLDSRTVSAYFIGYCTRSRGCRFYCPNYSTRVIESDRAFYFENDSDSGSNIPRVINLHNEDTLLPLSSQTSSSVAHVPVLDGENRDDILVENPIDPVVVPPIVKIGEPVVDLRRSQRSRKGAIPDDYIVYLQEFESNVVEGTDPVSYRESVSG
ncbi:Retrovirus-related Pol polyprotein from transposon TNT 1-94 [Senna tora]|uniref:Retrovirus-related Pol polyprotein from transposon TNT 1-94 n=1 Tax=Senna tora TaxID=362788 RepID=A0A834SRV4_9FABA|nr:Retrovirus-related Pol polyprotein from transposon TNT 1-94 [Senna tora]